MDWGIQVSLVLFLIVASCSASAEKVAPANATVGYFISLHDCAVAISDKCGNLGMASEFIFNETNSMCTWWCRPVRTQSTTLITSSSAASSSSSTTKKATSTTYVAQPSSQPDYAIYLIAGACVLVFLWQIIAYVRSLRGPKK